MNSSHFNHICWNFPTHKLWEFMHSQNRSFGIADVNSVNTRVCVFFYFERILCEFAHFSNVFTSWKQTNLSSLLKKSVICGLQCHSRFQNCFVLPYTVYVCRVHRETIFHQHLIHSHIASQSIC